MMRAMIDRPSDGTHAGAIGLRLRLTRDVLALSQAEFADRCGIARNTYNQYEQGKNVPQLLIAIAMCERFDLTLDWIYRGDPSGLPYRLADLIKVARAQRR